MKSSIRFQIQATLAVVTAALAVITLISHEWIELLFGVDPDGGNGALEWGIVAILLAASVTFSMLGYAEWKKLAAIGAR